MLVGRCWQNQTPFPDKLKGLAASAVPTTWFENNAAHALLQTWGSLSGIWVVLVMAGVLSGHEDFFFSSTLCQLLFLESPVPGCL